MSCNGEPSTALNMDPHTQHNPQSAPQGAACSLNLLLNQQHSIYKVARALKKDEHTLFNCLASIVGDSHFVQEIRLLYPDLPLLANLRAGGWYAPNPDGTCYFKSTDGHQNNCNFSVTRLNWHVAELATQKGGVIIVDATRKGKRFPDAMSKTIPIWAAVLNRAVARVRAYDAQKAQRRRTYAAADGEVFTAVADTQTTISVRTGEGCAALGSSTSTNSNDDELLTSAAASTQAQQVQDGPEQRVMSQLSTNDLWHQLGGRQQQQLQQAEANQPAMQVSQQLDEGSKPAQQQACTWQCCGTACVGDAVAMQTSSGCPVYSQSPQVVELLVDCMGPSVDLMAADLDSSAAGATTRACCLSSPAGVPTPEPGSGSPQCSAAAGVVSASGCCGCCLHRSKSVHISPQPSLHEWLDEMDVLRRLTLLADARAGGRHTPRVSCPSGCGCIGKAEVLQRPLHTEVMCAASAPAVSCLLDEDDGSAPATPLACSSYSTQAAAANSQAGAPEQSGRISPAACKTTTTTVAAAAAAGGELQSAPLPAFLLVGAASCGSGLEAGSTGEPVTPRLLCGGTSSVSTSSSSDASGHSSDEDATYLPVQQPSTAAARAEVAAQQVRFAQQAVAQHNAGVGVAAGDFAFPPPHQLAASSGSSVGAEAAGHLAASGLSSSGSSTDSGLVRLPDMPVVVLNGTSHQPGDAASILDIWRGTDLEDVACLPGISDFRPGVYHFPGGQQQQDTRERSIDDEDAACFVDWQSTQHQHDQEQQAGGLSTECSSSAGGQVSTSWAAEVCLRSQQQLSGRVSISNWLEDEETGAACDALCAFAVPALSPSCCSTSGSAGEADAAPSCCSLACGSQGSGSVCSDDSRPSSRQSSTTAGCSSSVAAGAQPAGSVSAGSVSVSAVQWDTALHLPLWVSAQEHEAIEAKLDGWVERLLEVGADVRGLAAVLTKPLRPLWVSQSSLIWTNQVAHPSNLPFTPLLLVSASQPQGGERQALRSAWLSLASTAGSPERPLPPASFSDSPSDDSDDCSSQGDEWEGLGLAGSWGSNRSKAFRPNKHKRSPHKHPRRHAKGDSSGSSSSKADVGSVSFVYVPGAGDDEESWAAGLTPALFWQHCDALLRCGPSNIKPGVKQLLQLHKSASYGGSSSSLAAAAVRSLAAAPSGAAGSSSSSNNTRSGRPLSPLGPGGSSRSSRSGRGMCVLTDQYHPALQGCAGPQPCPAHVVPAAPGAFWLGNTGLAVGNLEGASVADVWRTFDAVLCCGQVLVPVLQGEYTAMKMAAEQVAAVPAVPAVSSSAPCSSWMQQQRAAELQQRQSQQDRAAPPSSSYCTSSGAAHSHWVRQQQLGASGLIDSDSGADQVQQQQLEFGKVSSTVSKKPARKSGMLSALLSKSALAAGASCNPPNTGCGSSSSSTARDAAQVNAGQGAADAQPAGSDTSGSMASSDASSVCSSSYYSVCSDEGLTTGLAAASSMFGCGPSKGAPQLPRLKWLPVECAKRDRSSLKQNLQEALEFVSAHLAAGHCVLVHDVEGHDNCVCLAVAVLSACYTPPAAADKTSAEPSFVAAWPACNQQQQQQPQASLLESLGPDSEQPCATLLPPAPVSKQSVRQQLALVSGCYPWARPTRGMLKQVFNFFEERRRDAAAQA